MPLHPLRLRCDDEVLLQRINARDRPGFQKRAELEGAMRAQRAFDQLGADFDLVETSGLDSDMVASFILATR